jgi:hypothetical protein
MIIGFLVTFRRRVSAACPCVPDGCSVPAPRPLVPYDGPAVAACPCPPRWPRLAHGWRSGRWARLARWSAPCAPSAPAGSRNSPPSSCFPCGAGRENACPTSQQRCVPWFGPPEGNRRSPASSPNRRLANVASSTSAVPRWHSVKAARSAQLARRQRRALPLGGPPVGPQPLSGGCDSGPGGSGLPGGQPVEEPVTGEQALGAEG